MRFCTRRSQGFTLLELLVAMGIFALVSAMAYGGLGQILQTRDRLESERTFWRSFSLTFQRLDEDLGQARARGIRDVDGITLPAFSGQPVDMRALGQPSLEFTRGGILIFGSGIRSDLQRVGYQLKDGVLWRLTWPVLDRAPQTQAIESPMIGEVQDFTLRFYDDRGHPSDQWPPISQNNIVASLPRGVEVKIKFAHHGEFTRTFLVGG